MAVSVDDILYGGFGILGRGLGRVAEVPRTVLFGPPLFAVLLEGEDKPGLVRDLDGWRARHGAGEFGSDESELIITGLMAENRFETERASYWIVDREAFVRAIAARSR